MASVISEKTEKKTKLRFPHTLVLIFIMIIIAALLTYIIPAGAYDRIKDATGRTIVDAESFHYIKQTPVSFFSVFKAVPQGMIGAGWIMFLILVIGGSFGVITSTGAIQAVLGKTMVKLKDKGFLLIPLSILIFSIMASTMAFAEACLAFVPLGIILARALGFDALVGISMVTMGMSVGFTAGEYNPFTVGIAHSMIGLPLFSGAGFRVIGHICFYLVATYFITRYAIKVKKNPESSIIYNLEKGQGNSFNQQVGELTGRLKLVLLTILVGFGFVVYASVKQWSAQTDLPTIFLIMGIAAGLVAGYGPNKIAEEFVKSAKLMLFGALVVGFARGIVIVLEAGNIIDTVIFALSNVLRDLPHWVAAMTMYVMQIVINTFITSGSGQAVTTIPIMSAIGDILGLTQQTVVLAFQYGDGLTNQILPTSGVLMASLAFADVPYEKWVKFIWKLMLVNLTVAGIIVAFAALMRIGPF